MVRLMKTFMCLKSFSLALTGFSLGLMGTAAAQEVPSAQVPVVEVPLAPLVPAPSSSASSSGAASALNPFQGVATITTAGTSNALAGADAGEARRIAILETKIAELEQKITASRTLSMRQQMTRLRAIDQRLEEMALQIADLGIQPRSENGVSDVKAPVGSDAVDLFADPAQAATVRLRLGTIEENLRLLSGQTATLVKSLETLAQQVETVRQDNEFRFQQIEGNIGRAARDPEAMPSIEPEVLGQVRMASPVETLDAPVTDGAAGIALIGEGDMPTQNAIPQAAMRPVINDPKKLYDRALADLRSGAYGLAQNDFEQMLTRFPAHKLAGNAQYWLGETFYVRRQFKQAAEAFLAGYTTYQQSSKAPDSLLKLGMTLAAMGEKKTGCDAFKELAAKFPQAPQAIVKRVQIEKTRAGCAS